MKTIVTKTEAARKLIAEAFKKHRKISVACSFSNVFLPHLARSVAPNIPIFSVMTPYMPQETFEYLVKVNHKYNFNPKVYMIAEEKEYYSEYLFKNGIRTILLPRDDFERESFEGEKETGKRMFEKHPLECCRLLKVVPTRLAISNLDAWISGLRIPENHQAIELKEGRAKYNPLLTWDEIDIWKYLAIHNLPVHPYFAKGYRSLGCDCCSGMIDDDEPQRSGRWAKTENRGRSCGLEKL